MDSAKGGLVIALLFLVPLVAWVVSRLLVRGGFGVAESKRHLAEWEGAYYAFNDVQIRIYEEDGQLWFVADDVAASLGWKELPASFMAVHSKDFRKLAGTKHVTLDPPSLEAMLGKRNEHEPIRFLQWMRREVIKPWEKKK